MSRTTRKTRKRIFSTGAAILLFGAAVLGTAAPALADKPVLSHSTSAGNEPAAPLAKAAWSIPLVELADGGGDRAAAIAEEGRVFALMDGGRLAAYEGTTGKRLWTYGKSLKPLMVYEQSTIYGLAGDGSIYAVTADGARKWVSPIGAKEADGIDIIGDTVYVTNNLVFYALDRATGKLRWKVAEKKEDSYIEGYASVTESEGVVLRKYYVEGVHSSIQVDAYDKKTGKRLWTYSDIYSVLTVRGGLVYTFLDMFMREDYESGSKNLHIAVLDLKTGKMMEHRVYKWTIQQDSASPYHFGGAFGSAMADGNALYLFQDYTIAQYDLTAYKPDGNPVKRWKAPDPEQFYPLYKVHQGRLLYQNQHDNAIGLLKTVNGGFIRTPAGRTVVQTDLYGNGLYLGLADGTLIAYDFSAFKPVFRFNAGAKDFRPTLKSGGMLYVQAGGKLTAVKLPATLAKS